MGTASSSHVGKAVGKRKHRNRIEEQLDETTPRDDSPKRSCRLLLFLAQDYQDYSQQQDQHPAQESFGSDIHEGFKKRRHGPFNLSMDHGSIMVLSIG